MSEQPKERYRCTSPTCYDNGGTCEVDIPEGYEEPEDCLNVKSFTCNGDEPDCKWVKVSRPHPAPAQDQKAPICENCGLDSATCRMDMAGCLQAQNAAARKAREELLDVLFKDRVKQGGRTDGFEFYIIGVKTVESLRAQQAGEP